MAKGWRSSHGSRWSVEREHAIRAFGVIIQGALVQQRWASNQGLSLAGEEADEDGLAPLEEVI